MRLKKVIHQIYPIVVNLDTGNTRSYDINDSSTLLVENRVVNY